MQNHENTDTTALTRVPWNKGKLIGGFGFIRKWSATDAAAYEGRRLREGLLDKANTAGGVWADTAYRSQANEEFLAKNGFVSHVHRKKPKGRAMPEAISRANNAKSKIRSKVEHVFAKQKDRMGLFIRTIGIARATVKIGMTNLVYNIKRLLFLRRQTKFGTQTVQNHSIMLTQPIYRSVRLAARCAATADRRSAAWNVRTPPKRHSVCQRIVLDALNSTLSDLNPRLVQSGALLSVAALWRFRKRHKLDASNNCVSVAGSMVRVAERVRFRVFRAPALDE
jgi:hypothetical protein